MTIQFLRELVLASRRKKEKYLETIQELSCNFLFNCYGTRSKTKLAIDSLLNDDVTDQYVLMRKQKSGRSMESYLLITGTDENFFGKVIITPFSTAMWSFLVRQQKSGIRKKHGAANCLGSSFLHFGMVSNLDSQSCSELERDLFEECIQAEA